MRLSAVQKLVPRVTKEFIYYLERRNHIQPELIPKQRLSRRNYTERDVGIIRRAFQLYEQGYSPQMAATIAKGAVKDSASFLSLRPSLESAATVRTFPHAGKDEDRYIDVFPETHIVVVAKELDPGGHYALRASVEIPSKQAPFILRFRRGSEVVREIVTNDTGDFVDECLSEADLQALIGCELDIASPANTSPEGRDEVGASEDVKEHGDEKLPRDTTERSPL